MLEQPLCCLILPLLSLRLAQDASGHSTRRAIQPVLEHLGRQLGNMLSWQHRQLRNPLGDVALVPQLQLAPPASMAVQNFVNAVQLTGVGGSRAVEGVMLLHQAHVLWSSLAPEDSAALYSLAATALLHPPSGMQRGGEARCAAGAQLWLCAVVGALPSSTGRVSCLASFLHSSLQQLLLLVY